jgi:hypothetical protein
VWGVRGLLGLALVITAGAAVFGAILDAVLPCAVLAAGTILFPAVGVAGLLRWRTGRPWRGVCVAAWAAGLGVLVLICVFAWQPWYCIHAAPRYWEVGWSAELNGAAARSACHRLLLWRPHPFPEFLCLAEAGDQTSVPYILWAWPSTEHDPYGESGPACLEALRTITNNAPGTTLAAWKEWYEKNRRRPQMTWWADGFVAEGYKAYPYEDKDGPKAARELLAALGRSTWQESPPKRYLTFNAVRMLKKLTPSDVRKAMGEALKGEGPAEKRGLARYTEYLSRAEGEPMLRALAADGDRSVRLAATGQTCLNLVERWAPKANDPVWRLCKDGQVPPEVLAEPAGRAARARPGGPAASAATAAAAEATTAPAIVLPRGGQGCDVRRPAELPKAIREALTPPPGTIAAGTQGKTAWLIRTEGLNARAADPNAWRDEPYVLHVEGWSLQTGRRVYSRQLAHSRTSQADSICWFQDAPTGRLYISIPTYTAAVDVQTGSVIWEVGFGLTGAGFPFVLGPYLLVSQNGPGLVILDAAEGSIVTSTGRQGVQFGLASLRLVDGQLWAQGRDERWYVLDFSTTHAPWSEPAEQEPSDPTPGTGH